MIRLIFYSLFVFGLYAHVYSKDNLPASTLPQDSFENRKKLLLNEVWKNYQANESKPSGRGAFFRAEALFELGKVEEGILLVNRGLDQLTPGNKESRWIYGGNTGFNSFPGLDCYIRYEKFLDERTKRRYKEIYTGGAFYQKLSTSNHKIMSAVARYLATQIWGKDSFHPAPFYKSEKLKPNVYTGKWNPERAIIFEENDPTGENYIRSNIKEVIQFGPGEYASRPYGAENILPLLSIAECASDPELRAKALFAYECSIAQLAPAYLRGHLATFSPRSYPDTETQSPWGIAALLWVYFGGVMPNLESITEKLSWSLRLATAYQQLPNTFQSAGTDRSKSYVYRSLMARWALYHYVNKSYALFSRSPKVGEKQFSGQSYPCGVMWEEPDITKGSHLWITNPAADSESEMKIHTHGVTSYEQQLQNRDALLYVFNIPSDYRYPYVLGYIPGGYRASLKTSNQIFLHYGSVLIAISSQDPIDWNPNAGIRHPASTPHQDDSEFRLMKVRTAIAIETAHPEEFPQGDWIEQLTAFQRQILSKSQINVKTGESQITASYIDRNGIQMECTFNGADIINGKAVNYEEWPVLESPWTKQMRPLYELELKDEKVTRIYDFKTWSIK